MAEEMHFRVKGSEPEPYEVVFRIEGANLTAVCTCRAGQAGMHCKHRLSLLAGDGRAIVSDDGQAGLDKLVGWLKGTDVAGAMAELLEAETKLAAATREVSRAKKEVAKAMAD